jgi:hypothetical protein
MMNQRMTWRAIVVATLFIPLAGCFYAPYYPYYAAAPATPVAYGPPVAYYPAYAPYPPYYYAPPISLNFGFLYGLGGHGHKGYRY